MAHFIMAIGCLEKLMDMANLVIVMDKVMKVVGLIIWQTEKEFFIMKMEINMRAIFKMIKQVVMEY